MKIGIDISQIVYGTGVSVYTRNLVENLLKIDKQNEYILFGGSARRRAELNDFIRKLSGNFTQKIVFFPPNLADLIWNRLHLFNIENFTGSLDVFHTSDWTQPPAKAPKVATVHDVTPLRYPNLSDPKIVSVHQSVLKWIIREAGRVIAPSKATLEDLVLLKVDREKIRVIPEAADPFFEKVGITEINKVKTKYNISNDFFLAVGVGERKNTERIIEAFKNLNLENYDLVLVGQPGKYRSEKNIHFTGFVTEADLRRLYSSTQALIYPSIYEGFGLPILQAFACQSPVVTSNISSMPEVAGGAAILVDPFSVASITEGIRQAIKSRDSLIAKGLTQAKKYSWEKTAQMTLEVYQELK